ncbi:MAG: transcription termination factor Rho, partial [Planctomicrobium sp.]|nr:transcription termination factor Rho [Planctomicrobium sp.]
MAKSTPSPDTSKSSPDSNNQDQSERAIYDPASSHYEDAKQGDIHIAALQRMTMKELFELAKQEKVTEYQGLKKQDLIFRILKERTKMNGLMFGEGTLEILPDGFGFLRSPDYHYLPC